MKLYLDTAGPTLVMKLDDKVYEWEAGHELAEGLLGFMRDKLAENGKDFTDISEIEFFSGPGSFTGLRIGASVVNTLASELDVLLYKHTGERVPVILPDYGRPANISAPKK